MSTLLEIREAIKKVIKESGYTDPEIDGLINDALQAIAGGVLMPRPSTDISPPLPELYVSATVETSTSAAYVSLPSNYQRHVFLISDSSDYRVHPVLGGDYYSFALFMNAAIKKDLSLSGSVQSVCVKGNNLYYQGIPATATDISLHYYRKPATLTDASDEPEGIPAHFAKKLLKHYVCKEEFGENIEDGEDNKGTGEAYHTRKFYETMDAMVKFIGEDAEPVYYGSTSSPIRDAW